MAGVIFAQELILDGSPYKARRVQGARGIQTDYVPIQQDEKGSVQLEPANAVTWHRGSGASLPLMAPTPTAAGITGMHAWGNNAWTCDPGLVLPGPFVTTMALPNADGDVADFCEQDGDLYVFAGRYVSRIAGGTTAAVAEQDMGVGFATQNAAVHRFNNNMYVGGGPSGHIWEKVSGGAWNQSADTYRGALGSVFWSISGVTSERLVGVVGTTGVRYCAFGADAKVDANWTPTPTPIDVGPFPIQSCVATQVHIYFATTGGLRDLDSSGVAPNLMPQVENEVFASNGLATLADGGYIYMGAGYGLLRVNVANQQTYAMIDDVSPPGENLPSEIPVTGLPLAITRYGQWILLAQWDPGAGVGGTTYISYGRQSLGGYGQYASKAFSAREVGPMVWNCSPIVLPGQRVTRMHVSGLVAGNPRLWMGCTDNSGVRSLRWAPLPLVTAYQDLRNARAYRFATTYDLYETYEDWGDDAMQKVIPDGVWESEGLGAGSSVTVAMAIDGNAQFDQFGVLNTSPAVKLTAQSEVKCNRVQIKYTGNGTSVAPPILRKRQLRAFARPDLREVRTYQLNLGTVVRHVGGNPAGTNTLQQKAALAALQKGSSVTMRDEDGQALRVLVASGVHFSEVELDVATGHGEKVLAATVTVAVLTAPGTTFKWGDGTRYGDSGKVWA